MGTFKRVAVAAMLGAAMLTVGCTQSVSASQDPAKLEGVQWTLSSTSESDADVAGLGISAKFDGERMSGFAAVNSYTGPYEAGDDGTFKAGPLATTMIAGPEAESAAEAAYLELLEAAETYEVTDGTLILTTADGKTLEYKAEQPFELSGSSWMITNYNNGKEAVVGLVEGSELTLEFADDGSVSGSGGVNRFNGPYEATEDTIKIGPLMNSNKAASEELMTQEQQYLAALAAATKWEVANGVLTLRDDDGAIQVVAEQQ